MSRLNGEAASRPESVEEPAQTVLDEDEDESEEDAELDGEAEKDETEEELERLVFGDSIGFREGLKDFALGEAEDERYAEATGLEGLDDADVGQALNYTSATWLYC